MAKTRKRGGGTHVTYFKMDTISADPNFSPAYKSCGIITSTSIKAINAVRNFATKFVNGIGSNGFELSIYKELRKEAIDNIQEEMKKEQIDAISSFRIEYIENPTHIIANCYGTALKKR